MTCKARSKQSGERCKRAPIVFGEVCTNHGGNTPAVRAKAQAAAEAFFANPPTYTPGWRIEELWRAWTRSNNRYQARLLKKNIRRFGGGDEPMKRQDAEPAQSDPVTVLDPVSYDIGFFDFDI